MYRVVFAAVYSKKPVGHGESSWTLEEVYMETSHVLSGLSRKSGLHLLSPASNPVETASTATTHPGGGHATSNELSELESAHENGDGAELSACGPPTASHQEPADVSCYFKFPTNDCELFHRDDENIDMFNDKPISGNEELNSVMCSEKQSSSISAIMMNSSVSEGNKDNLVSGSDCKPFTDNEVSDGSICCDMSLPTINTVRSVASSSLETGDNDASMFNMTSVSPSTAISPFGEASVPPQEEGGRMKVTNNEDGLDEWPDRVMSYERSSLFLSPPSATSSLENRVNLREREENITKLLEDEKKPSLTRNPCSVVNSEGNDAGLLELEECATSLVNDENGIGVQASPVPFQEKLSSTLYPCLADSSVGKNAGMWELEKCSTNLVNDDNGISVGEEARLVDEVDRLSDERNCLTSQEKSSSTIGPLRKIANSLDEQQTAVVEDRLDEQDNDMCDEKRCSPISSSAVPSAKEEKTTNLVNRVDGLEESGHEMSHENPSFTSSSIVTSASISMVEANMMKLAYDEDRPGVEQDHETYHREQSSTCGTVTDISAPRGNYKTKKKAKKINTNMNKRATVSSSDVKVNSPFQTWLQNFTTFCKTQNEVEQKQVETSKSSFEDSKHQGASITYSGKQSHKNLKVQEEYLSGNLESCNTSVDIPTAMETDCVPPATVCSSVSEYVYEDSTVGRTDSLDQEQVKFASDSLNSAKSVSNRNVPKVLEAEENEIYNVKDDQSVSENAKENMEIGSEDTYARKRSLLIDNSGEVEQPSQKKLRNQSDSEYKERIQRSLDTTWDKSDDLPLMANVDEVLVHHYILDLSVKFSEKIMKGNIVLFLEPRNEEVTKKQFQMTLDSSLVNIESVSEVALPDDYEVTFCGHKQNNPLTQEACSSGLQNGFLGNILGDNSHTPLPFKGLSYSVYGWCVQIWKPEATGKAWPRCVWIKYHTSPEGTSLTWATDQDGK